MVTVIGGRGASTIVAESLCCCSILAGAGLAKKDLMPSIGDTDIDPSKIGDRTFSTVSVQEKGYSSSLKKNASLE